MTERKLMNKEGEEEEEREREIEIEREGDDSAKEAV